MARTPSKSVKTLPISEELKVTYFTEQDDKYLITRNSMKQQFTLWKCLDDGFERISTSSNPLDFDDKISYKGR